MKQGVCNVLLPTRQAMHQAPGKIRSGEI
uniref:Uncharacterized protein n=1 Tax=Arundo donax TaxID=35708 RepID=A0A0A8ZDJ2_ARUDO